jgi:predicted nucleotidyltransferase
MATIDRSAIQALCDRIVAEFRPERVILFGSHAYGVPRPDSDVDLLVILPFDEQPAYKAIEIVTRAPTLPSGPAGAHARASDRTPGTR